MKILIAKIAKLLTTTVALSVAIAVDAPKAEAISLIEKDLFFGRNLPGGREVSEAEFEAFVDTVITPRFPDGLTIFDADGQFRNMTNTIIEEQSKVVTLFVEDTPQSDNAINEIVLAYLQQFDQESVLQVTNEDELKVGFGVGENLIDNNLVPEFIQADLFFGRNISGGGEVSEAQFQEFVDNFITPLFPDGLTIFDADGQFRDDGTINQEQTKVVRLLFEDTQENEDAIDDIIQDYLDQFNQESVLLAVNEEIAVGFGVGENLIDNDLVPEFIQADLFFGRDIPGGGEVSEADFQEFVANFITPRFPDGLTIFDADGQFRDDGTIIQEQTKVVTLLFEDTQENEDAIDDIIQDYLDQFNQESFLLVVDEDVEVAFDASPTTSVPEPSSILGLLTFSTLGAGLVLKRRFSLSGKAVKLRGKVVLRQ